MKNLFLNKWNSGLAVFMAFLFSTYAWAQDEKNKVLPDVDIEVNKESDAQLWYMNPLYWIIGALILVILIAIVVRSGKK